MSEAEQFAIGDVVYLKSGSHPMVVEVAEFGNVSVGWFKDRVLVREAFHEACLTKTHFAECEQIRLVS